MMTVYYSVQSLNSNEDSPAWKGLQGARDKVSHDVMYVGYHTTKVAVRIL